MVRARVEQLTVERWLIEINGAQHGFAVHYDPTHLC
jgi:hypothetical protein